MNKNTKNGASFCVSLRMLCVLCGLIFLAAGCSRESIHSSAALTTESATAPAAVRVSSTEANASEPAIASAGDGSSYVVWVEHRGKEADVMLRRFDDANRPLTAAVRVNPEPGAATAWRGDPPTVAVADDGTVYVAWNARVDSPVAHASNILVSASHDGGKSFNAPVKVNDTQKPTPHGMHSLVVGNGLIYVAWLDERNVHQPASSSKADPHMEANRDLFVSVSTDGGRTFSPNTRVANEVCPCCKTSLALSKSGRVYVAWRQVLPGDFRHIAVSSSADGKTFTKPAIVSDDQWLIRGCPVSGPALSASTDGKLLVLWYAGGEKTRHGVYWSESVDDGQTFSPRRLLVATDARGTPLLVHGKDGVATAIWEATENGINRVFTTPLKNGQATGDEIANAGVGELPAAIANGNQIKVAAMSKVGEQQIVWLLPSS